jgi:O-antigen ligase
MRTFFIVLFLGLVGTLNFEMTLANHEFSQLFPTNLYFILVGISFLIFLTLWVEYRVYHPFKPIEWLFIVLMVYPLLAEIFGDNQLILSEFNSAFAADSFVLTLPLLRIFQGIFNGASIGMILYVLYFFTARLVSTKTLYRTMMGLVLAFVIIEVLYSLVVEWQEYVYVFNHFTDGARLSITSFTTNTNIYSFNLTMGVYAVGSLFMSETKQRWIYPLLGLWFFALIILTVSKTAIFAVLVYAAVYLVMLLYRALQHRKFWFQLVLGSLLVLGVVGLQTIFALDQPLMLRIQHLLTDSSLASFTSRVDIWMDGMTLFHQQNTFFGYGLGLSNTYLGFSTAVPFTTTPGQLLVQIVNDRFHNGFLEILVSYGLVGTLLLTLVHWEYFKALIALTKKHPITVPMWALLISFAVQMMFEDRLLFRPDLSGVFFMTLLILPLVKPNEYNGRHEADV